MRKENYNTFDCAWVVVMLVVCGRKERRSFHEWRLSLVPALPSSLPKTTWLPSTAGGSMVSWPPVWIDPGFGWFVECKGFA